MLQCFLYLSSNLRITANTPMKLKNVLALYCLLLCTALPLLAQQTNLRISELHCDHRNNPMGVENLHPQLSWQLSSPENGQHQTAYQVLVASSEDLLNDDEADLWNSGKVRSGQSVHIPYDGKPLQAKQRYYWKVKAWDKDGLPSSWSQVNFWEMGLLTDANLQAKWLRHPAFLDTLLEPKPAPYFRKDFTLTKPVRTARAYVTGLGYFEMELNGQKVGDEVLAPVKTDYNKTVSYVVHDITTQLRPGENTVGIILGTGWYNHFAQAAWAFNQAPWRTYPEMLCQLEVTYTDGTREVIASDDSWRCSQGPIRYDGIRNGEHYDARLEMPGWSTPAFDDSGWQQAVEVAGPKGKLTAQYLPPIKEMVEIKPVSVNEVRPGVYVFDLGQNIAGYSRIKVAGPAGTEITLKHGEKLFPDGTVEQTQILRFLRTGEAQTDKYILKGEGVEAWHPRFVYHGYQYVEVSGLPVRPTLETLTGVVLHTSFERNGQFACSNPMFNRIQELMHWAFIGNYHGIPTDCPHREKIGWTGDGHLVAETGLYNYNSLTSYLKWMDDFVDAQREDGLIPAVVPSSGWGFKEKSEGGAQNPGPQWRGAFNIITWHLYRYSGDTSILARYYAPAKKYVDYLRSVSDKNLTSHGIDDHKAIITKTDGDILSAAYYYHLTDLTARMAEVLGKQDDQAAMSQRAEKIRQAYNRKYFNQKEGTYGHGGQTPLAMSLALGLVPEDREAAVREKLKGAIASSRNHFDVGVVGIKSIYDYLGEQQQSELIYRMVNQTSFPSYGWWIEQGANTLWQDWDGKMSHNHIMFGSVSEWFYQSLAGINPDDTQPGFKHINFRPEFLGNLDWVSAEHESLYGKIVSSWERKEEDQVIMRVAVPVNASATVFAPEGYRMADAGSMELESGKYEIIFTKE
jgi:alpha-L-rhamnosidase